MPKQYPSIHEKVGRPIVKINWDEVDAMLYAGSPANEIADSLGIHRNNFYKRCIKENGVDFTTYVQEKRSKGNALLRLAQYRKAIGKTKEGDTALLIHLGKHMLGQVDKSVNNTDKAFEEIDPTKRDTSTDTLQVSVQTLSGSGMESPEGGLQEGSPVLA